MGLLQPGAGEWSDVSSSITLEGTATAGSATYSSREVAKYVRGDTVKYVGFIQLSSVGGIQGQVIIAGVDAANEDVASANFPVGHILTSGGAPDRWAQAWWSINSDIVRGRYEGNWWTHNDIDDDTAVYFYLEYRKA